MALNAAETYIALLVQHMASHKVRLRLASEAQPEATRVPVRWKTEGDGRARGGREDIWPISRSGRHKSAFVMSQRRNLGWTILGYSVVK
jgi:hypothetical protein